ncbi:MAG: hypothetical protein ACO1N9_01590 [Flavobacterium sp.]
MKKLYFLAAFCFCLASCDFILKDRKDDDSEIKADTVVAVGNDKDAQGCVTSAGYRWSDLKGECVRVYDVGYRLNSIDELEEDGSMYSAFVLFENDGDRAELFLPDGSKSVMLKREAKDKPYINNRWQLTPGKGYSLSKSGTIVYRGAPTVEKMVTGSDNPEN